MQLLFFTNVNQLIYTGGVMTTKMPKWVPHLIIYTTATILQPHKAHDGVLSLYYSTPPPPNVQLLRAPLVHISSVIFCAVCIMVLLSFLTRPTNAHTRTHTYTCTKRICRTDALPLFVHEKIPGHATHDLEPVLTNSQSKTAAHCSQES